MAASRLSSLLLLSSLALAGAVPQAATGRSLDARQVVTPDNTCGGANGYTCNPNDSFGGPCCSSSGWCGTTSAYCGTGCQTSFSSPGACAGSAPVWKNHREHSFASNTFPDWLSRSSYPVQDTYPASPHVFEPGLATVSGGYLNLVVPGGQAAAGPLRGAEVTTTFNFKFGSIKTTAIFSEPAGVCNGIFNYGSMGRQESDIEWLSDANSQSNNGKRWVHFTNQDVNGVIADKTYFRVDPPANPTSSEHEYRIDWFADRVEYYIDGVLKRTMTTDVPSTSLPFLWNNWSNNDIGWTGPPPKTDANFRIKKIVIDYN